MISVCQTIMLALAVGNAVAFVSQSRGSTCRSVLSSSTLAMVQRETPNDFSCHRNRVVLFASEQGTEDDAEEEAIRDPEPTPVALETEEEDQPYPIDLPSPVLLSTSMVSAIAGVGSLFELSGGNPQFGFAPTAAIAAIGVPVGLFLFYASIVKAQAETAADDAEFLNKNKKNVNKYY